MELFLKQHEGRIKGIIAGFDRILFKGSLRSISSRRMMEIYLFSQHILFQDFGTWAEQLSDRIKEHAKTYAEAQGASLLENLWQSFAGCP